MKVQRSDGILNNMIWRFGEKSLSQIVTFVVSILLARLLSPDDFGTVAILLIFIDIADAFVVGGFDTALVQKKDADDLDFSTIFWFCFFVSILLYCIIFVCAPQIGNLFNDDSITPLLRVISIKIVFSSINISQQAVVQRKMLFRRFFFSTLGGTIVSAVVGVMLALYGMGAWAIVGQYLTNTIVNIAILWITVKWRPKRCFSVERLKTLFDFGFKMFGSQILMVVYNRISSFLIGSMYSAADLAFYEQGNKLPGALETNIDVTINSVMFPAMSKEQDNRVLLKMIARKTIVYSSVLVWPMMIGMAVLSEEIIILLYTEKWINSIFFMQIACIYLSILPIQTTNLQVIKAIGRGDVYFKIELLKRIIGITILLIMIPYGVKAIAVGTLISSVLGFIINAITNKILIDYKIIEQLSDFVKPMLLSVVMGVCVYLVSSMKSISIINTMIEILIGVIVYYLLLMIFMNEELQEMQNRFKIILHKDANK